MVPLDRSKRRPRLSMRPSSRYGCSPSPSQASVKEPHVCRQEIRGLPLRYGWHGAQFDCRRRAGVERLGAASRSRRGGFPADDAWRAGQSRPSAGWRFRGSIPSAEADEITRAETADVEGIHAIAGAAGFPGFAAAASAGRSSPHRRARWRCGGSKRRASCFPTPSSQAKTSRTASRRPTASC